MIHVWSQTKNLSEFGRFGDQAGIALILANPSLDHHFWTSCARQFFLIVWRPAARFTVLCFCGQKKLKPALLDILNIYANGFTHIWVCDSVTAIAIFVVFLAFFVFCFFVFLFFWAKGSDHAISRQGEKNCSITGCSCTVRPKLVISRRLTTIFAAFRPPLLHLDKVWEKRTIFTFNCTLQG